MSRYPSLLTLVVILLGLGTPAAYASADSAELEHQREQFPLVWEAAKPRPDRDLDQTRGGAGIPIRCIRTSVWLRCSGISERQVTREEADARFSRRGRTLRCPRRSCAKRFCSNSPSARTGRTISRSTTSRRITANCAVPRCRRISRSAKNWISRKTLNRSGSAPRRCPRPATRQRSGQRISAS